MRQSDCLTVDDQLVLKSTRASKKRSQLSPSGKTPWGAMKRVFETLATHDAEKWGGTFFEMMCTERFLISLWASTWSCCNCITRGFPWEEHEVCPCYSSPLVAHSWRKGPRKIFIMLSLLCLSGSTSSRTNQIILVMVKIGWFVLGDAHMETSHFNSLHTAIFP